MCSAPIARTVVQPFVRAGRAIGTGFENTISHPVKYSADELARQVEMNVSHPIKYSADTLATGFENEISEPLKEGWNNRNAWFKKPGVPDAPIAEPEAQPDPPPTYEQGAPGSTAASAMARRRRLAALRMGILSTMRAGPLGGLNLLNPSSGPSATADKVKLGQ